MSQFGINSRSSDDKYYIVSSLTTRILSTTLLEPNNYGNILA